MAQQFDQFPVYDPITKSGLLFSPVWQDFMGTFFQNLTGYLCEFGMLVPSITTSERNSLRLRAVANNPTLPLEGQLIYNSDRKTLQVYLNGGWQEVTTTPAP